MIFFALWVSPVDRGVEQKGESPSALALYALNPFG
jgi:hypothetical protein